MKHKKVFLIISIIAAFLGCIADVLLLYSPNGNYHSGDYAFLMDISLDNIIWGHYLGVLLIPLELLGLWVVIDTFNIKIHQKIIALCTIAWILTVGVAYHGMIVFVAEAMQKDGIHRAMELKHYFEPFGAFLAIGFVILIVLMIIGLRKKISDLPLKIIFWNPAIIYLLLIILYFLFPPIGNILIVAGFNLSIAVFLMAIYYHQNSKYAVSSQDTQYNK